MLKIRLECKNIEEIKLAKCLFKFGRSFPFSYKIRTTGDAAEAEFVLTSQDALNELTRRLKHIKNINFRYAEIRRVSK